MTVTNAAASMTFVEASRLALDDAMTADPSVILLGEDIGDREGGGVFKVTSGLTDKHGSGRVRTTPISEQAIVGAAIGAAVEGLRPVAEIMFMNFISVCMDQLVNHAAKLRFMSGGQTSVPLTIRTAPGAGAGFAGQHSDMLEVWLAHTPGLKVVVPSSPADTYGLLTSCIFDDDPCVFIENSLLYFSGAAGAAPERGVAIPLGRANILRPGSDVTVISYGKPLSELMNVAEGLTKDGVGVEVIDLRTIAPWDERTVLESVSRTGRAVIVHEAVRRHGIGAEISSRIHEELFGDLRAPVQRVGSGFSPVPFSMPLEYNYLYSGAGIEAAIRRTLG